MVAELLPWGLSVATLAMNWAVGSRIKGAWAFGVVLQCAWLAWIIVTSTWGFLPMNLGLAIIFARNHYKWLETK